MSWWIILVITIGVGAAATTRALARYRVKPTSRFDFEALRWATYRPEGRRWLPLLWLLLALWAIVVVAGVFWLLTPAVGR